MNSLDALAAAAKEGAGIGHVRRGPVEAGLAAGHPVRLLADRKPGASTVAPDGFSRHGRLRR
jgi:hypothetical protein